MWRLPFHCNHYKWLLETGLPSCSLHTFLTVVSLVDWDPVFLNYADLLGVLFLHLQMTCIGEV